MCIHACMYVCMHLHILYAHNFYLLQQKNHMRHTAGFPVKAFIPKRTTTTCKPAFNLTNEQKTTTNI